jgi:hypothetical protein
MSVVVKEKIKLNRFHKLIFYYGNFARTQMICVCAMYVCSSDMSTLEMVSLNISTTYFLFIRPTNAPTIS